MESRWRSANARTAQPTHNTNTGLWCSLMAVYYVAMSPSRAISCKVIIFACRDMLILLSLLWLNVFLPLLLWGVELKVRAWKLMLVAILELCVLFSIFTEICGWLYRIIWCLIDIEVFLGLKFLTLVFLCLIYANCCFLTRTYWISNQT